jgi:hypothetical protein
MTSKQTKAKEKPATETPREAKERAVYTPTEVVLADVGLTATIQGINFRAFVTFAAPVIGRIFGVIHSAAGQNAKQSLSHSEYLGLLYQGFGLAMANDPDAVIRLMSSMSDLTAEQIAELSPADGTLLLEACAERISIDDISRFFGGTTRLSGISIPGTT